MRSSFTLALLVAGLAVMPAAPVAAATSCVVTPGSVDYVISNLTYQVDNIIRFNEGACSGGRGGTYTAPATSSPYSLANVFYPDGHDWLFLLGTATDLAGDPPGQKHVVVFGGTQWAASAQNIAFGTLFPTTLESNLIAALEDAASGNGVQSSYDYIDNFWNGDAQNAGLKFAPGDSFSIMAFSTGQNIGSGSTTFTPAGGVPEPASWTLLIGGFGMLGTALRRRQRHALA